MTHRPDALKFLLPNWFSIPMGLAGLALAWQRAVPLMGEVAGALAIALAGIAALVFAALAVAALIRWQRFPTAWAEDLRHPVRHTFVAAVPAAVILLATAAVALFGPGPLAGGLWWIGSVGQLGVTAWVMSRWWRGNQAGGLQWAVVTPALFVSVVGNVLVPLAGVPLGHAEWAAAQFGIGLLFWPVVLILLLVRIAMQGLFQERLLPSVFIVVAPPSVIGLAVLPLGAPLLLAWACWGMAAFSAAWAASLAGRMRSLPFSTTHWAISFPLAAFTSLTLRLATPGGLLAVLGPALLALTSVIILALALATVRGLREGSLLAPEPVAPILTATPAA